MTIKRCFSNAILAAFCGLQALTVTDGFAITLPKTLGRSGRHTLSVAASVSDTSSSSRTQQQRPKSTVDARRKELFSKKEAFFSLNRRTGRIEFGAPVPLETSNLPTTTSSSSDLISSWIRDSDAFGMSMWQESHLTKLEQDVFRLGLLTLQFVNLKFEPWVDVRVKTVKDSKGSPVFTLQSIGYNPNPKEISFIPGMPASLTLDDVVKNLDIGVEVVGQIRGTSNGARGRMVYVVTGKLPSALLLFPDPLLRGAGDTISKEVVEFAQKSFRTGTSAKFPEYQKKYEEQQKKAQP
mmetsp:Transcript_25011/g.51996  ORF Transcript_25011/g.51996 Transcript_25011/m.51996 type:complete len:295 (-) Transcript_25011:134-1018(-)|eukprot:CAMPEP_0172454008 /NCGR_PEP_ID=MMETSP1065-20121228/11120_1 /TAXON_ID=265537 /ORGANISM="Amphiprora paludosa, Strain CCMP125" /LENGTH=294 /DNA_ID=CAMNT_0013206265 /DNA_START=132 /DNA_END=1016 /DNA_ORIENTATION=+